MFKVFLNFLNFWIEWMVRVICPTIPLTNGRIFQLVQNRPVPSDLHYLTPPSNQATGYISEYPERDYLQFRPNKSRCCIHKKTGFSTIGICNIIRHLSRTGPGKTHRRVNAALYCRRIHTIDKSASPSGAAVLSRYVSNGRPIGNLTRHEDPCRSLSMELIPRVR